jgi:hypothetical protein
MLLLTAVMLCSNISCGCHVCDACAKGEGESLVEKMNSLHPVHQTVQLCASATAFMRRANKCQIGLRHA